MRILKNYFSLFKNKKQQCAMFHPSFLSSIQEDTTHKIYLSKRYLFDVYQENKSGTTSNRKQIKKKNFKYLIYENKQTTYFQIVNFFLASFFFHFLHCNDGRLGKKPLHAKIAAQNAMCTDNWKQTCSLFLPNAMVYTVGDMNMFCWYPYINISQVN